jgi:ribose 5-phosphate isomerase B
VCLTSPQRCEQASPDHPGTLDDRRSLAIGRHDRGEVLPPRLTQEMRVALPHDLLVRLVRREHVDKTNGPGVVFPPRNRTVRQPAMRIVVGADDEGQVADDVIADLRRRGHDVSVLEREQWPEVARKVAEAVASGEADQGVLFCWTGTGTSMAANKVPGVRAALAWDPWIAEGARRWNDANVLVMSLKRTPPGTAKEILDAWFGVAEPDADEAENIARLADLDRRESSG